MKKKDNRKGKSSRSHNAQLDSLADEFEKLLSGIKSVKEIIEEAQENENNGSNSMEELDILLAKINENISYIQSKKVSEV